MLFLNRRSRFAFAAIVLIATLAALRAWHRYRTASLPVRSQRVSLQEHPSLHETTSVFVFGDGRIYWQQTRIPGPTESGMQESIWSGQLSQADVQALDAELRSQNFFSMDDDRSVGVPDEAVFTIEVRDSSGASRSVTLMNHGMTTGFAAIRERLLKAPELASAKKMLSQGDLRSGWLPSDW